MNQSYTTINHVSDTALWVAYYRAQETLRPDALFHDHLANRLMGERGKIIAQNMQKIGTYTAWSVVSRTVIIDTFILNAIEEGVDMVINLGAGLDTRPYRMSLPATLKWIEVDYSSIIDHKNSLLQNEKTKCDLTRVALDLANDEKRKEFLSSSTSRAKKVLVLTEGVVIYLTEAQVAKLANDLFDQPKIEYWIAEYFTSAVYKYLKSSVRTKKLQKSPFQFFPKDWNGFFAANGWVPQTISYSSEIARKFKRKVPMPWFAFLFKLFATQKAKERAKKMSGYMLLKKRNS